MFQEKELLANAAATAATTNSGNQINNVCLVESKQKFTNTLVLFLYGTPFVGEVLIWKLYSNEQKISHF